MRQYGNGLVVGDPVTTTAEAWYFTHHFVDLESMTSKTRQFFQSKREDVGMRTDQLRANQIRFNKGQSKAIRNCILQAMPRTLVLQALQAAKKGVSAKMEAFIKAKGLAAAQNYTVNQLKTVGVDETAILAKVGKDKVAELRSVMPVGPALPSTPAAVEAEAAVLGAILLDAAQLDAVVETLPPPPAARPARRWWCSA
jgi:hypothetical protein